MFAGSKNKLEDFGDLFMPEEAAEPILGPAVRGALMAWLTEIWSEKELAALGVKARRKAIFAGPPGSGKTTLAHHLAARLGLPMLAVRPDCVIDMWVGASGKNIGRLFEATRDRGEPIVLFIDEFDTLAPKRRAAQQGADQARNDMVNTLLQRLEQHDGFLIAATNYSDQIDPAMWRRFEMHVTLDLPGQDERVRIVERYLAPLGIPSRALDEFARALDTASPALIRSLCENLKRQTIVDPKLGLDVSKEAVFDRLLTAIKPHDENGLPRLWSQKGKDRAVTLLPWPLPRAEDLTPEADEALDGLPSDPQAAGAEAFKAGRDVLANPYPFGDARRAVWDAAWRRASGSDGMGASGGTVLPFNGGGRP